MNHVTDRMAVPESSDTSSLWSSREHCDDCWEARVIVRIHQESRFRSPWSWCSHAVSEYVPFCALQACFENQASEDRFVFPVGHGVLASGPQVRRLLRTGEFDICCGVALNVERLKISSYST